MDQDIRVRACDQGDKAFDEVFALLVCLKEACTDASALALPEVAKIVALAMDRLHEAHSAFQHLTAVL